MEALDVLRQDLEFVLGHRSLPEGTELVDVLKRLDGQAQAGGLPGDLQHYIERRSYTKALAWVEDPTLPHRL
ncbi:MAG: hypothetical protein CBC33_006740 [Coraliomargarita sp. TMED73]|nr:MAG: hypothetical protein CBC33_006740 [Coraliomargarita sp. TMED73]|tara:strand:+ start:2270 stop:2485 length:216 start_codon:yes stop_codon:yes gene_type:complete